MSHPLLDRFPTLAALPAPERDLLLAGIGRVALPAGHPLFRAGELCAAFPFLMRGSVAVRRLARSGREMLLYRVQPGQTCIMTTVCLATDARYAAEGVVEADAEAWCLPPSGFTALLAASAGFRAFAFASFATRLVDLMTRIEELSDRSVEARLAERLLALAPGGVARTTHQALAGDVGTAREVVSRALEGFARAGLVELGRGLVTLCDAAGLRRLAAPLGE